MTTDESFGTSSAADLLRLEASALVDAAARVDEASFRRAVELLANCEGKAILSGSGTSGIIARKIAATLTSTGTPAIFLHPADAVHGGLGAVSRDDVVVAVSNSGETEELLALLPYVRSRHVPLIVIAGRTESSLARAADVVLDARADKEACPFNLAPTSSTTVALAVGDALAVLLYEVNGLTPEQFAVNHPSGSLGRRLTLRVSDVMRAVDRLPRVPSSISWLDVVTAISDGGLGAVVVLGDSEELLGIITDGDLRRAVQRTPPDALALLTAEAIMTREPITVAPELLAYDALQVMEDRPSQISVLPVVDGDQCVGMVRVHDLVRAGV